MVKLSLFGSKILLATCNILLLIGGFTLVTAGILILTSSDTMILSQLITSNASIKFFNNEMFTSHPIYYYVGIAVAIFGLILAGAGILGCWAACLNNYCAISSYFIIIITTLIFECTIYLIAWLWPHCLGISLNTEEITKNLQQNYGSPNNERLTNAIDLLQTHYNCCGIDSAFEYDTSLWRLQSLGPHLTVPLSCCKLVNRTFNDTKAYLNPIPINTTLCQAVDKVRHENYRHLVGCQRHIEEWYIKHQFMFIITGLVIVLIQFIVLLSTVLTCNRVYHHKQTRKQRTISINDTDDNVQQHEVGHCYSNDTYGDDSFRYKIVS